MEYSIVSTNLCYLFLEILQVILKSHQVWEPTGSEKKQ